MKDSLKNDPNFSIIINYLENNDIETQDLINAIQRFKNSINISFISNLCRNENPIEILKEIFDILFKVVRNNDQTVKISVFSTFGAIIFFLSPFLSVKVINSFLQTLPSIEMGDSVAISIIACYSHLTHYVSITNKNAFYSSLPIIEYFGKDIQKDLKYLPFLLSNMVGNNDFNIIIFNRLLESFKDSISIYLIKSLFELIKMSPEILNLNKKLLEEEEYRKIALNLFPMILCDKELMKCLTKEDLIKLLTIANDFLLKEPIEFNEFEQACIIISRLMLYGITDERTQEIFKKEIPEHLKVLTFKIDNNIEHIMPVEKESKSVWIAKIDALSYLLIRTKNEKFFIDGLNVFLQSLDNNGETFSHAVEALTLLFPLLPDSIYVHKETKEIITEILEKILNKERINWVQEVTICKFLAVLDKKKVNGLIRNFSEKRIRKVLPFCISKQKILMNEARKCIKKILTAFECQYVIEFVINTDIFDSYNFCCCLDLINELGAIFNYKNFMPLKSIFMEAFFMTYSITACASFLTYLNNINESCNEVIDRVVDLFAKIFKSFTGSDSGLLSPIQSYDLPPFGELVETNILTKQWDAMNIYIDSLKEAFVFLSRLEEVPENFFKTSLKMVPVFPEECFEFLKKHNYEADVIVPRIREVLITTQSISIASKAAELAALIGARDEKTTSCVMAILNEKINDGEDLSDFYKFCGKDVLKNTKDLDSSNFCLFNFLTDSSLTGVKIDGGILAILRTIKFKDWPLYNHKFKEFLDNNIDELSPVKDVNTNELDDIHNKFIGEHPEAFSCEPIERFSYEKQKFEIVVDESLLDFSSITPSLVSNDIIDNEGLLKNFCEFSTLKLEKNVFIEICKLLVSHRMYSSMFKLAIKQKMNIPEEFIENAKLSTDDLFFAAKYYNESKKKSASIKKHFKTIASQIKNPVLIMKTDKRAAALVEFMERPSLETFIKRFVLDENHIMALMYFVNKYGHVPDKEEDLIKHCLFEAYIDPYDMLWLLRYIRSYSAFKMSLPEGVEDSLLQLNKSTQMSEIRGIIARVPCKKYIKRLNENYLHELFIEGEAMLNNSDCDSINQCIKSEIPSLLCSAARTFKFITNEINVNTFYYTYWNLVLAVKDTTNCIVLDEYKKVLFFIESNDFKPKQYTQYMKPAAKEQIDKFSRSADQELFAGLFEDEKEEENTGKNIMSIANNFFINGTSIGTHDIAIEAMEEMGNMGAAYFIMGLVDSSKIHFFDLYATLAKIMRRMTRDECSTFKTIANSQIIPNLKNKKKAHSISLLMEGSRKLRLLGSEEASSIDSSTV